MRTVLPERKLGQAEECQSIPTDANLRYQCKGVIEVLHAQWAKEQLVQKKRVSRSSIQENIRLPSDGYGGLYAKRAQATTSAPYLGEN